MQHTENYGLNKPDQTDKLVGATSAINANFDTLDTKMKNIEENKLGTDNIKAKVLEYFYPVNSVYLTVEDVNPSTLFGGTWVRLENYLIGSGDGTETGAKGSFELTLTSDVIPTHTHFIVPEGTVVENGAHTHSNNAAYKFHIGPRVLVYTKTSPRVRSASGCSLVVKGDTNKQRYYTTSIGSQTTNYNNKLIAESADTSEENLHTHNLVGEADVTSDTGDGTPLDITPPYLSVYAWRRTA